MDVNAAATLDAIRLANLALCGQWFESTIRAFERTYRLNLAVFEAFRMRPLAAAQAAAATGVSAAVHFVSGAAALERLAHGGETYRAISSGLSGLVAEYAGDMEMLDGPANGRSQYGSGPNRARRKSTKARTFAGR